MPNAAYGTSKAAMHWLTKRMDAEEEGLNAFVLSPAWTQTEMGNAGAKYFGLEEGPTGVEECCVGMVKVIVGATKEKNGGRMWLWEGEEIGWC